jgi:hypothetical protein
LYADATSSGKSGEQDWKSKPVIVNRKRKRRRIIFAPEKLTNGKRLVVATKTT